MKLLREASIIILICFLGEILNKIFKIQIPGNVVGMVILLAALLTGVIKLKHIENISDFLLKHLAFFFIPGGVSLIAILDILGKNFVSILTIVLVSTIVVIGVTGLTVQILMKSLEKREVK